MKPLFVFLFFAVILIFILWLGLQIKPRPFTMPDLPQAELKTVPIPENLPEPVSRFYGTVFKDQVPVIDTVVITGRGRMRPFGIWLPTRFMMIHNAGRDYRHYFEATFFGVPFLKVNEGYVDGKSFFESPMGTYYDDPNTNQGANLALWAEGGWFPSLWVTDPRTRWQAVDDNTAILYVPFEAKVENFVIRFDPKTGLVDKMEAMRFRASTDQEKILWITNDVRSENKPTISYATWLDSGKPWLALTIDEIKFNLDVSELILARGLD